MLATASECILVLQLIKQGCHAIGQTQAMFGRCRLQMLLGCNTQSRNGNLIIKPADGTGSVILVGLREQTLLHGLYGHADGIISVIGQQTLVQPLLRPENRLAAQQYLHEFERGNVAPQHQQAHRQRCGKNQADRPPKRCPEGCGNND